MTGPTAATTTNDAATTTATTKNESSLSLSERYQRAIDLSESSPTEAIVALETMQHELARLALFSSNEGLEDISTKSLPLLALEHYLAMAHTRIPTPPDKIRDRRTNLLRSIDLWTAFLQKLDSLSDNNGSTNEAIVTPAEQKEYQTLMECSSSSSNNDGDTTTNAPVLPAPRREDKIARFKAKQQAKKEVERLRSLRERRGRIGVSSEEVMDDFDEETLDRTVAMTNILLNKAEALEEWAQTIRELPMIERMVQAQEQQSNMERHSGKNQQQRNNHGAHDPRQRRPPAPANGIQVTHVTLDATNQLQFRKEQVKSQVFRPGWTQPTMSLEEFGDRERNNAIEREHKQQAAEANRAKGPRKYEQLLRDGKEDNADAVDASAAVDRAWDDWKDENPRGSGNKRGDQGDRNF